MTAVSVVVPARNAALTIARTLEALAAQELDQPYEVIVVDNGSDDDTAAIAERAPGPVRIIRKQAERPGAARNRGAAEAVAPVLAFTDADCVPTPNWLRSGLAALEGTDLVQGAVRPDPNVAAGPFDRSVWVSAEVGLYETANLFVTRSAFDRAAGFEDWLEADISRPCGEDVWFGWKVRRAGGRTSFCQSALVYHAVFPREPREYALERTRLSLFPALADRIPELRDEFFYRRWFLSRRSAAFDAALLGVAAGLSKGSSLPLLAALPYAWLLGRSVKGWGRRAPKAAAVELVADAVGFAALVGGSLRWRAIVV